MLSPEVAYNYLLSRHDVLRRLRGEKRDKKYIATFDGVNTDKQIALWRNLKGKTRIKLESYSGSIRGVKRVECAKNADLTARLRNGLGVCVEIDDTTSLGELVDHYYGNVSESTEPEEPGSPDSTDVESHTRSVRYRDFGEAPNDDPAELSQFARKVRAGQREFRSNLLDLYEGTCAVSAEKTVEALEAAHVLNHSVSGLNHSDNGLLLRADIHLLFDKGYLAINPDNFTVWVHRALKDSSYWSFNGAAVRKRKDGKYPSSEYLLKKWYEKRA